MVRKLLAIPVLAVLVILVFGQVTTATATTASQTAYNFEFLDIANNYQRLDTFPWGKSGELVVASRSQDVRQVLPIEISIKENSQTVWKDSITDSHTQCRGATGCSIPGPVLKDPGATVPIEIVALSLQSTTPITLVSYRQGPSTQPAATSTSKPVTTNSNNNWFQSWWLIGFWVGVLLLLPWVFVGWQWARLRFWGFGWPWPWWFWIPLGWFIPWLFVGWQWWLVWWPWWVWLWWLWPWVFWPFWWIVVFKESIIWLWKPRK